MKKNFSRFLAAVLAMMMALAAVGTAGAENGDYQGQVKVKNGQVSPEDVPVKPDGKGGWILDSGIDYSGTWEDALDVRSDDPDKSSISSITVNGTVTGSIDVISADQGTANAEIKGDAGYIYAETFGSDTLFGGTVTLTVGGNATDNVVVYAQDLGTVDAEIKGNADRNLTVRSFAWGDDSVVGGSANVAVGKSVTRNVDISARDQGTVNVEIKGGVGRYISVDTYGSDSDVGGSVTLTVGGDAGGDVDIWSEDQGTAEVEIKGSIEGYTWLSVYRENSEVGGTASLTAEGTKDGVWLEAEDQGTVTLTLKEGGIVSEDDGLEIDNENSFVKAEINGGITAKGYGAVIAETYADPENGSSAGALTEILINGDVSGETEEDPDGSSGAWLYSGEKGAVTSFTLNGNLSAKGEDGPVTGARLEASLGGEISFETNGRILATGGTRTAGMLVTNMGGLVVSSVNGGDAKDGVAIRADGNGKNLDAGAYVTSGSIVDAQATGVPVSFGPEDDQPQMTSMFMEDEDGSLWPVCVLGDDYYIPFGTEYIPVSIDEKETAPSATTFSVTGDVVSSQYGLMLLADEGNMADVIVDGTISGEEAGLVLVGNTQLNEDVTVTVWKLEATETEGKKAYAFHGETNALPFPGDEEEGEKEESVKLTEFTEEEYKKISYILKFDSSSISSLEQETAGEGEEVLVKINLPEGGIVKKLYWTGDGEKTEKEVDEDIFYESAEQPGSYYVKVPRGGGVMLSVEYHVHTQVVTPGRAPTCTEPGWTEEIRCAECNELLKARTEIPATGHIAGIAVKENVVAPQVGVAGSYDAVIHCVTCHAELSRRTVVIPPLPVPPAPDPAPQSPKLFTVTIDPNGGKVDGQAEAYKVSLQEGAQFVLPAPEPPEGKVLAGWYAADIGKDDPRWKDPEEDDPNLLKAGNSLLIQKNVVLTAIWKDAE